MVYISGLQHIWCLKADLWFETVMYLFTMSARVMTRLDLPLWWEWCSCMIIIPHYLLLCHSWQEWHSCGGLLYWSHSVLCIWYERGSTALPGICNQVIQPKREAVQEGGWTASRYNWMCSAATGCQWYALGWGGCSTAADLQGRGEKVPMAVG